MIQSQAGIITLRNFANPNREYAKFINQMERKRFAGFNDHRWDNRGIPLESQEDAEDKRLAFKFSK